MQQRVLAGIDARLAATAPRDRPPVANLAREEVGCALRLAPGTAADRLAIAGTLCDRLPATLHALEAGVISYWHARALAEAAVRVDPVSAARLEQAVLPEAGEQSVGGIPHGRGQGSAGPRPGAGRAAPPPRAGRPVRPAHPGRRRDGDAVGAAARRRRRGAHAGRRRAGLGHLSRRPAHRRSAAGRCAGRPGRGGAAQAGPASGAGIAAARSGHHLTVHAARPRRAPRRAGRTRRDPRRTRPPHRRRPHRQLAAAGARPGAPPATRLRQAQLPATRRTGPVRHRPRPALRRFPSASATPPAATWTTRSATPTAVPPAPPTSPRSAPAITPSKTTAAGRSPANPTATTTGPAPPAAPTQRRHPAIPIHHHPHPSRPPHPNPNLTHPTTTRRRSSRRRTFRPAAREAIRCVMLPDRR